MCENYACCAGDPNKVSGTGTCVPLKDLCAHRCGLIPKDQPHWEVDPFPRQEAVLYCYVKDWKRYVRRGRGECIGGADGGADESGKTRGFPLAGSSSRWTLCLCWSPSRRQQMPSSVRS